MAASRPFLQLQSSSSRALEPNNLKDKEAVFDLKGKGIYLIDINFKDSNSCDLLLITSGKFYISGE
ncbi:MAG: hypothetical protein LKI42_00270 [Bacteroidales bacterium]|jgi:hypothetical protein|nr:hypothetical protein [Bacteroidales bacterium]MCI1786339.1 hypothetical protein [Bacteroidales bacterium]